MSLSRTENEFILHWGEMGSRWGVNRSVAQVHALLFLKETLMAADEICDALSMARSNVSTSIKELQSWHLIETRRDLGDRREKFIAVKDGMDLVKRIAEGRRQREFLPTIAVLERLTKEAKDDPETSNYSRKAMEETLSLMKDFDAWYEEMRSLSPAMQKRFLRLGAGIAKLLPKAGKD